MSHHRLALGSATLIATLTWGAPARGAPVRAAIAVDGDLSDWTEVLTSPANVARDGDGSQGCTGSTDLDCPVSAARVDLARFAWTWDDRDFLFYVERRDVSTNNDNVVLYMDLDDDGLVEDTDVLAFNTMESGSATSTIELSRYVPSLPGGDPLVEPVSGSCDGFDMPGDAGSPLAVSGAVLRAPSGGAAAWEGSIPWSALGLLPGSPLRIHVALATGRGLPGSLTDNLGATTGGPVSTGWRAVAVEPDITTSAAPGTTLVLPHRVRNAGNLRATASFVVTAASGNDLTFMQDADGDGIAETLLGFDKGGDGVLTLAGDRLTPEGDSNGDGILDTGPLLRDEQILLEVAEAFPSDATGLLETIDLRAWVQGESEEDVARDLVRVGDVTIAVPELRTGAAGDVVWVPHSVVNNTGSPLRVDLSAFSSLAWPWTFWSDPDRDGLPGDAVALTDGDATGRPDVSLGPGASASILARAAVPTSALPGRVESLFARAMLGGVVQSAVADRVVVGLPMDLYPSHLVADGDARYGGAGGSIYFHHRIVNHRGATRGFDVTATSSLGWPAVVLVDPDGDGLPGDAVPLSPLTLGPNGGQASLFVRVDVPAGTRLGETSRIDVSAASADGADVVSVADDAVAAIVRLYADAGHSVNVARLSPCATAFAAASGLTPLQAYRFAWLSPTGALARTWAVTTDPSGACEDTWTPGSQDSGPGWAVEIQQWDGIEWDALDGATFTVGDGWQARGLHAGRPEYGVGAQSLDVLVTMANDDFAGPVLDEMRFVVLCPDRTSILSPAGAFVPYTGAETTADETVTLDVREQEIVVPGLAADFPRPGTYAIELWRSEGCTGWSLAATATFEVIDDADGDGLLRDEEALLGTDPDDADSDDDGVRDSDEAGDGDGDGRSDATECDRDGDGLPDGLELGYISVDQDTDPAAGCFRADADPSTVTDPSRADTDGGGVADGVEDPDRDGSRDAGETDPLDAADDAASCSPSVPPALAGLRVGRPGAWLEVTWTPVALDPCTTFTVLASDALPAFAEHAALLPVPRLVEPLTAGPPLRCFLAVAVSSVAGQGPSSP